jgi:hypothetical protein
LTFDSVLVLQPVKVRAINAMESVIFFIKEDLTIICEVKLLLNFLP